MNALTVVVHSYGELLLGGILTNDVLIEKFFDFERLRKLLRTGSGLIRLIVFKNGIANAYALVADIGARIIARRGDQLADNILAFMAKRTTECIVRPGALHANLLFWPDLPDTPQQVEGLEITANFRRTTLIMTRSQTVINDAIRF